MISRADRKVNELEAEIEALMAKEKGEEAPTGVREPPVKEEVGTPETLSKEEETWKKRFGDLRRHSQSTENSLKDEIKSLKSKLENVETTSSVLTKEQIKEWAKTNPQASEIIRALAAEHTQGVRQESEEVKRELAKDKAEAKVRRVHPDFESIVSDNDFHDWAETQPSALQNLIYDSTDADGVIWALNLYKKDKNISTTPEKDAAKGIGKSGKTSPSPERGKGRFTESVVAKMSPADFEKNWDAINEAMKNPNFYDMSGGAR